MFRLLELYLIREIVPYILLGLLLLTAIVFAHDASRFSELLVVTSRNGLPMQGLWRLIAALIPGILVFTLPISLLVGTLVGLGRLSGDSEIIALKASGVSRAAMLKPVIGLGLVIAALMLYITFNVLPRSIFNLNDLKANQPLILQGLNTQIKPRVFEESIPGKVLYVEDIDRAKNVWHNIFLVDLNGGQEDLKILTATSGSLRPRQTDSGQGDMPELYLKRGFSHQISSAKSNQPQDEGQTGEPDSSAAHDQQPARMISEELEEERKTNPGQQNFFLQRFEQMTLGIEFPEEKKAESIGIDQKKPLVREMLWSDLIRFAPAPNEYRVWRAEIHKRWSLPAACLVFALLGVALGISNVRTGRSFGLLLGLAITIAYYLLALWGESAAVSGKIPIWLGVWMANIILAAIGVIVILIQRRPGSDALSLLASLRHAWPEPLRVSGFGFQINSSGDQTVSSQSGDAPPGSSKFRIPKSAFRNRMPQLLDRLVLSDLVRFFFFILGGFSILFIIITLFQLLDRITRNNIEWAVVVDYLVFLLPMIVNYVTPLAALVAVMVTFGILQKTSQVVALKASGQSIYRLAVPVLLASLLLSSLVFVNQDYILPFTNRRQNNLRHLILKGQEPPQTFYQTANQWIFGMESRIYNYAHFDPTNNVFARLNVIDLSRQPFAIKRRIYAQRARWDGATNEWVLENGWERQFEGERLVGYQPFKEQRVALVENPDYFKRDTRGSSSLTLTEIRKKIADLSRSGFDVLDLQVALHSKIAFPLTCLIMVIVGLPFSLSVGKRGALYGVTIGIGIGLLYWGLLGLFEQMGRYEILPPMLAAWGPNMLFGAGGAYLFLTSRT